MARMRAVSPLRMLPLFLLSLALGLFYLALPAAPAHAQAASDIRLQIDGLAVNPGSDGKYELFPDAELNVYFRSTKDLSQAKLWLRDSEATPSPTADGQYEARLLVTKKDGDQRLVLRTEEDEELIADVRIRALPQVLDPTGQPAYGGRVTLYKKDEQGLWQVWKSPLGSQRNPKQLGFEGKYAFYLDPGEYHVRIESPGAALFKSDPVTVTELRIFTLAAELKFQEESLSDIELDTSVVSLVSSLLDRLSELRNNGQIINITKKALQPFSFAVALSTLFGFIFSIFLQFGLSFATMPMLPLHAMQMLIHIFTGKRHLIQWGKVFDYKNSNPIPMASVMLFHEEDHKLIGMAMSEIDGSYSFPAKEGKFSLFVTKRGYRFPTEARNFVYRGDTFTLTGDSVPPLNLPMDKETENVHESKMLSLGKGVTELVKILVLFGGFGMSVWMMIFTPSLVQATMIVLYLWMMYFKIKKIRRDRVIRKIQGD